MVVLHALLVDFWQLLIIPGTVVGHLSMLGWIIALCKPGEEQILEATSFGMYKGLLYLLILPLKLWLWIFATMVMVVVVKRLLFPCGMKAAGFHNNDKERWEYPVNSWGYLRWWTVDHVFRCTKPLIYNSILRRSRLSVMWYWALGMNVDVAKTLISTDIDDVGEWDFWNIAGRGTVFTLRNYAFDFDDEGRHIMYIKERREVRNDVDSEVDAFVPITLSWIGFVPSTLALGSTQWIMRERFDSTGADFQDFDSYFVMLWMFVVLALVYTCILKQLIEITFGCCELGNLLVECVDIIPSCFAFSCANTFWLRAIGVGVLTNNIFSGAPTPRNASMVMIGDNVFLSNSIITGPATIGDDCMAGLKARIRPFCHLKKGAVVAAHTILQRNNTLDEASVLVRKWQGPGTTFAKAEQFDAMVEAAAVLEVLPTGFAASKRRATCAVTGDVAERDMRLLGTSGGKRSSVETPMFTTFGSHLPYVIPRVLQFAMALAAMALNMEIWHKLCGTLFFTFEVYQVTALTDPQSYPRLGFIGFFLTFMLLWMPLLMLVTKWTVIGRWEKVDPSEYFSVDSWTCRRYFAFMGAPIWVAVRNMWQPRFYGTRVQNVWYRALGATIGNGVLIFSNGVEDYDQLLIGDHVAFCHGTFALGHLYEGKGLSFGTVTMGKGSTVLADRQLWPGAEVASGCQVYGAGAPIRGRYNGEKSKPTPTSGVSDMQQGSEGSIGSSAGGDLQLTQMRLGQSFTVEVEDGHA